MLGYLMHKHPAHVCPIVSRSSPGGGRGRARSVLGVLLWENRNAQVCDDTRYIETKENSLRAAGGLNL